MGQIRRDTKFYNNGKMLENLHFAHFTNAENSENQTFPAVILDFSVSSQRACHG